MEYGLGFTFFFTVFSAQLHHAALGFRYPCTVTNSGSCTISHDPIGLSSNPLVLWSEGPVGCSPVGLNEATIIGPSIIPP